MPLPWLSSGAEGVQPVGGRRGRRAVTRIEKLAAARTAVDGRLTEQIELAVSRARARGVPWPLIARALGATPWRVRLRYRRAPNRTGRRT